MAKDVFVVESPKRDAKGSYILIVQQGHGMFGGSSSAFSVDRVVPCISGGKCYSLRGMVGTRVVVEFSGDSTFVMIDKKVTKASNITDLEIEDRREAEESKKKIDEAFPEKPQDAVTVGEDGRAKVNTQGYL